MEEILIPAEDVLVDYPKLTVKKGSEKLLYNGNALKSNGFERVTEADRDASGVRVYAPDGRFAAIYRYKKEEERFVPVKMFPEYE